MLLQQTQVITGIQYYTRFLEKFPTIDHLAQAPVDEVLKAWEGCGYYARARNLHKAAQRIQVSGFPKTFEGWLTLPGIGPYTAAAVSSIAFNAPRAAVDGNVRRVLSRIFAQADPNSQWLQDRADQCLVREDPGTWNQALMELGATLCTPKNPKCGFCPIQHACQAHLSGHAAQYPNAKRRPTVHVKTGVALIIGTHSESYLEKRPPTGILGGLFGLPTEETLENESKEDTLERLCHRLGAKASHHLGTVRHAFTHQKITLDIYSAQGPTSRYNIKDVAISRLDQKAFELLKNL